MCINYQFWIILKNLFTSLNQSRVSMIIAESSKDVNPGRFACKSRDTKARVKIQKIESLNIRKSFICFWRGFPVIRILFFSPKFLKFLDYLGFFAKILAIVLAKKSKKYWFYWQHEEEITRTNSINAFNYIYLTFLK